MAKKLHKLYILKENMNVFLINIRSPEAARSNVNTVLSRKIIANNIYNEKRI